MWKDWDSTLRLRSFTIIVMTMKVTKTRGGSRGIRCLWASSIPSSSSTALISGALTNLKQKFEIEMWHVTLHFHIRCHSHMTVHCNNYHMYINTLVNVFQGFRSSSAKNSDKWSRMKNFDQFSKVVLAKNIDVKVKILTIYSPVTFTQTNASRKLKSVNIKHSVFYFVYFFILSNIWNI